MEHVRVGRFFTCVPNAQEVRRLAYAQRLFHLETIAFAAGLLVCMPV